MMGEDGLSGTLLVRGTLGRCRPHSCWICADTLHWKQLSKSQDAGQQRSLFLGDITSVTPNSDSFTFRVRALAAKDFGFVHRTFVFAVPKSSAHDEGSREARLGRWICGLEEACSRMRIAASPRSRFRSCAATSRGASLSSACIACTISLLSSRARFAADFRSNLLSSRPSSLLSFAQTKLSYTNIHICKPHSR